MKNKLIIICLCFLSGCVQQHKTPRVPYPQRMQIVNSIDTWHASGRASFRNSQSGESANVSWKQDPSNYELYFAGPFSIEAVKINSTEQGVILTSAECEKISAPSAEELIMREMNWEFPFTSLQYWIKGAPNPNLKINYQTLDYLNQVTKLEQGNWVIEYDNYQYYDFISLPKKITLRQDDMVLKFSLQWKNLRKKK